MANKRVANDCVSSLSMVIKRKDQLGEAVEKLRKEKSLGTVIFLDLVGSTGYRREYGPEKGLEKAFLHNTLVSQQIIGHGGWVVKWIGDEVMGCFSEQECGSGHSFKALLTALDAIESLNSWSRTRAPDEQIHTKVSISAGAFHYMAIEGGVPEKDHNEGGKEKPGTAVLDPIGSNVDLAARLGALAEMDVIVIDAETFWGYEVNADGESHGRIESMCDTERGAIRWRELQLDKVRETVYIPSVAALFVKPDCLRISPTSQGGEEGVRATDFEDRVRKEAQISSDGAERLAFVLEPVRCNIRGFKSPVEAVAVSCSPQTAPIRHAKHDWSHPAIVELLRRGEKNFRSGKQAEALSAFGAVVRDDPRNFQANVRLAMLNRATGDTMKAMKHLEAAKESDAACALVWGSTGMTYLAQHLSAQGNMTACLSQAITAFSRARHLAAVSFHGLLEQYCTCLLAICYSLKRGAPNEVESLLKEMDAWPAKNDLVEILVRLAHLFFLIEQGREREQAEQEVMTLAAEIDGKSLLRVHYDSLVRADDILNLVEQGRHLLNVRVSGG